MIQSLGRGWQARRRVSVIRSEKAAAELRERLAAAEEAERRQRRLSELQLQYEREYMLRRQAVIVIQKWFRGVLAKAILRRLRQVGCRPLEPRHFRQHLTVLQVPCTEVDVEWSGVGWRGVAWSRMHCA
jgi:hypothetical protein